MSDSEAAPHTEENQSEVESLRSALDSSQKKAADYYDQLLRLRAEFDNFRKRAEREKSDSRAWGKQEVLMELISMVDVFEQALAHAN
jgi:molecular chaperone GrpE